MVGDTHNDVVSVALDFAGHLGREGIAYVVGGSLASSMHGEPRSTLDVDVVADIRSHQLANLVAALADEYYLDADVAAEAVANATSFNAIHTSTSVKVDVFVAGDDRFEAERLRAAVEVAMGSTPGTRLRIDAAAHLLLRKLEWYRRGGEVSERQWRDVVGIAAAQGDRLDRGVLDRWASALGVQDLVDRLLTAPGDKP